MHFRNYLFITGLGTIFLVSSIGYFNYLIDPYRIYDSPIIPGINLIKPELENHVRLSKAVAVLKRKPDNIVLGNSRSEYGISPSHKGWSSNNSYNLAIPGANLYEMFRYFEHANGSNNLKQVVAGLDFYMFNIYRPKSSDFDESILKYRTNIKNPEYSSAKIYKILFSIDLFFDSISTVLKQSYNQTYREDGQLNWNTNQLNVELSGGHRRYFLNTESRFMNGIWLPGPNHQYQFSDPVTGESTFHYFRKLLSTAYEDNIDLRMFISPGHARLWEALYTAGLWNKWESWKIKLVNLNENIANHYNKEPFPIWDFSGYNKYTTEEVPLLGDTKSKMKWYWESSHYKKELGDIILNNIFNTDRTLKTSKDVFGVLINSQNINSHLELIRKNRTEYINQRENEVSEIYKLVPIYLKK